MYIKIVCLQSRSLFLLRSVIWGTSRTSSSWGTVCVRTKHFVSEFDDSHRWWHLKGIGSRLSFRVVFYPFSYFRSSSTLLLLSPPWSSLFRGPNGRRVKPSPGQDNQKIKWVERISKVSDGNWQNFPPFDRQ